MKYGELRAGRRLPSCTQGDSNGNHDGNGKCDGNVGTRLGVNR